MIEVIENKPRSFVLWGLSADVANQQYAAIGFRLMDEVWRQLRTGSVRNVGLNHWVYLDGSRMFVGVELLPEETPPDGLNCLQFVLDRRVEYLHVGPYQTLPSVWQALKTQLRSAGEVISGPSIEIYGHQSPDSNAIPETTIIIALQAR